MSYGMILAKFRVCMEDIGNALREVLGTDQKYKFIDVAEQIRTCNQVFYLGEGTSFDVSGVSGYKNLTADNFIVDCGDYTVNGSATYSGSTKKTGTLTKTYDASTGILTIEGIKISNSCSQTHSAVWEYGEGFTNKGFTLSISASRVPQVWLCKGNIRDLS